MRETKEAFEAFSEREDTGMTVFVCKEEVEDIWCGIYDAWMSRLGHKNVRLEPEGRDRELFCEYRQVVTDMEKAEKVIDSIRQKLSEELYETVYRAALSEDPDRADKIYRFLIYAFAMGVKVMDCLQIPAVFQVFQMVRYLSREYTHIIEFTRFSQMEEGILFGKIAPKNDLLALVSLHFSDRLSGENWILYDCNRKKAAVHQADKGWAIVRADTVWWQERLNKKTDEECYENLWKTFHRSIAIAQRTNLKCQQNMLPLRFRPYMTEFL